MYIYFLEVDIFYNLTNLYYKCGEIKTYFHYEYFFLKCQAFSSAPSMANIPKMWTTDLTANNVKS